MKMEGYGDDLSARLLLVVISTCFAFTPGQRPTQTEK
jgi:hypothetical protein